MRSVGWNDVTSTELQGTARSLRTDATRGGASGSGPFISISSEIFRPNSLNTSSRVGIGCRPDTSARESVTFSLRSCKAVSPQIGRVAFLVDVPVVMDHRHAVAAQTDVQLDRVRATFE